MDLILILLCRSLDRSSRRRPFRPSTGVIVTALIRGATGGPAGLASEIGAAGSSVGEGAPTSRRSRRQVGPGGGAARTDEWPLHRAIGFNAALPTSRRRPGPHRPAGALALVIRGGGTERLLTHRPIRGAASRRARPRQKGAHR